MPQFEIPSWRDYSPCCKTYSYLGSHLTNETAFLSCAKNENVQLLSFQKTCFEYQIYYCFNAKQDIFVKEPGTLGQGEGHKITNAYVILKGLWPKEYAYH